MDQNNKSNVYAPPMAPVADPELKRIRDKPKQVTVAVWLLCITTSTALLSGWENVLSLPATFTAQSLLTLIFTSTAMLAINGWIIYKISLGRNWSRMLKMTTSVFSIISFVAITLTKQFRHEVYLRYLPMFEHQPVISQVISWIDLGLLIVVLSLLFTKPGSEWFKTSL